MKLFTKRELIKIAKNILGIPQKQSLSFVNFVKYKRLKYGPYIYRKKYTTDSIIQIMKDLGMKSGSNVFIHSSWGEFYNYLGTEKEFIDAILSVIGEQGTLIMPAYPLMMKNKIFDVKKSVTGAGLLSEEFRRYPGVKRSINVQHSVCALGPQADFLLNEHHLSETPWDMKSPYYKLSQINALVFCLGLPPVFNGTMMHCVEACLKNDIEYFSLFFDKDKTTYEYIDYDGERKSYSCYDGHTIIRQDNSIIKKMRRYYFGKDGYQTRKLSNLHISVNYAAKVIPTIIDLGRKGIVIYKKPNPKLYTFEKSIN